MEIFSSLLLLASAVLANVTPADMMEFCTAIKNRGLCGGECMYVFSDPDFDIAIPAGVAQAVCEAGGEPALYKTLCPSECVTRPDMEDLCGAVAMRQKCNADCLYVFEDPELSGRVPPSLARDVCSGVAGKYTSQCPSECLTRHDMKPLCRVVADRKQCAATCSYAFTDPSGELFPLVPDSLVEDICMGDEGIYKNLCPDECTPKGDDNKGGDGGDQPGYCDGELDSANERCAVHDDDKMACLSEGKSFFSDGLCDWVLGERVSPERSCSEFNGNKRQCKRNGEIDCKFSKKNGSCAFNCARLSEADCNANSACKFKRKKGRCKNKKNRS